MLLEQRRCGHALELGTTSSCARDWARSRSLRGPAGAACRRSLPLLALAALRRFSTRGGEAGGVRLARSPARLAEMRARACPNKVARGAIICSHTRAGGRAGKKLPRPPSLGAPCNLQGESAVAPEIVTRCVDIGRCEPESASSVWAISIGAWASTEATATAHAELKCAKR